jgi:hypothetical protein
MWAGAPETARPHATGFFLSADSRETATAYFLRHLLANVAITCLGELGQNESTRPYLQGTVSFSVARGSQPRDDAARDCGCNGCFAEHGEPRAHGL